MKLSYYRSEADDTAVIGDNNEPSLKQVNTLGFRLRLYSRLGDDYETRRFLRVMQLPSSNCKISVRLSFDFSWRLHRNKVF